MQIRKFLRIYQGLLISILILLCIIAGIFFGIVPIVRTIIGVRKETVELQKTNDIMRTKINILDSTDEEIHKKYLAELAVAVPQDKSLTTVFSTIDSLGTLTGVTLSDFTLTKPGLIASGSAAKLSVEEKNIGSNLIPFTLTVTGTYGQIRDFFGRVVLVRRFFRVRHFDLTFTPGDTISARLGMDAYYAVLPTRLGSSEQSIEPLSGEDEQIIAKIMEFPILSQDFTFQTSDVGGVDPVIFNHEDPFSP